MSGQIVVINTGSATVKFASYTTGDNDMIGPLLYKGIAEFAWDGARFSVVDGHNQMIAEETIAKAQPSLAIQLLLDFTLRWLRANLADSIIAFGHRVVHGGDKFSEPILVNESILTQLEAFTPMAPLHQPFNLAGIRSAQSLWPDTSQVACFDTAFHQTQPRIARMFGLPFEYFEKGIKRYGFHGLSYEFIASVLPEQLGERADGKVIAAHLGSGASLCAMQARKSVATTMGFTALDGLVMGTRSGSVDPGVILHLMNTEEFDSEQMAGLLYRHSGLLGISGLSADMRALLASDSQRAADAVDLFVYNVVCQIGGLIATLGGLDALIFTGGIGIHSAAIRRRICEALGWIGIRLNDSANTVNGPQIDSNDSAISVWVTPTDEEKVIATHTHRLIANLDLRTI